MTAPKPGKIGETAAASADSGPTLTFVPAATVVIFRHAPGCGPAELLMTQRSKAMRFAGGAAVFPGGRIDPADRVLAALIAPNLDPDIAASRVAAVRETLEETGLAITLDRPVTAAQAIEARALLRAEGALAPVLDRFGWTLALDRLVPFAHWRPQWDGAFDTRFFAYDLGTGAVDVMADATETTRLFWASAASVLAMADTGECNIIFPTRRNLERLAQFASYAEVAAHAAITPVRPIAPTRELRDGVAHLTIPDGLGYPVTAEPMDTVKRG